MHWTDPTATDLEAIEIYAGLESDYPSQPDFIAAIERDEIQAHAKVDVGVEEYYLANLEESTSIVTGKHHFIF